MGSDWESKTESHVGRSQQSRIPRNSQDDLKRKDVAFDEEQRKNYQEQIQAITNTKTRFNVVHIRS